MASAPRFHTTTPASGVTRRVRTATNNTFAEPGIQCEACHGPGSLHAATPTRAAVLMDDSAELCGRCHSRPAAATPGLLPADRFIRNNDQYSEMKSGAHSDLTCSSCHLHHVGVRRDQTGGIVKQCTSCHEGMQVSHFGNIDCITCHMPYATKSARSRDKYVADVRSHVFKIHAGPEDQAQMFDDAGNVKDGLRRDARLRLLSVPPGRAGRRRIEQHEEPARARSEGVVDPPATDKEGRRWTLSGTKRDGTAPRGAVH